MSHTSTDHRSQIDAPLRLKKALKTTLITSNEQSNLIAPALIPPAASQNSPTSDDGNNLFIGNLFYIFMSESFALAIEFYKTEFNGSFNF